NAGHRQGGDGSQKASAVNSPVHANHLSIVRFCTRGTPEAIVEASYGSCIPNPISKIGRFVHKIAKRIQAIYALQARLRRGARARRAVPHPRFARSIAPGAPPPVSSERAAAVSADRAPRRSVSARS